MINDVKKVLIGEEELAEMVARLGREIPAEYKSSDKPLVVIVILNGSLIFASDLVRKIDMPLDIEFMKVSSYGAGTKTSGEIKIHLDLNRENLENYNLLIVEDIVDSGRTLSKLIPYLEFLNQDFLEFNISTFEYSFIKYPEKLAFDAIGRQMDSNKEFAPLPTSVLNTVFLLVRDFV